MIGPVLVAYASRYGSTREVAEAIGATLREHGMLVEVRAAAEVDGLDEFGAVVLGGGIYMGRWHRDARGFVRHFGTELADLPVAVFALGPTDDEPSHRAGSEKQFRAVTAKFTFAPVSTRLFGGVIDPAKLHFPFNHMPAADVRDWGQVREWAEELVDRFEPARRLALA
jgi:menaquinone-dependent protoporphyrinogen oxidase